MNWMIDGAHGDLYRQAMGYESLPIVVDEWEIERRLGSFQKPKQLEVAPLRSKLHGMIASVIAFATRHLSAPATQLQITRK